MEVQNVLEEIPEQTLHVKLVSKDKDPLGYTNYVFEDLEFKYSHLKYITLVRFPNWAGKPINIGQEGFVRLKGVKEGKDKWYDSVNNTFWYYKNTSLIFLQFVPLNTQNENQIYTID